MKHSALAWAAIVAVVLSVGLVHSIGSSQSTERSVDDLMTDMEEGGALVMEGPSGVPVTVPLSVRSDWIPEKADGSPDNANRTLALYGETLTSQARLVMRGDVAKLAYNGPGVERTLILVIGESENHAADENRSANDSGDSASASDGPHSIGWQPGSLSVEEFSPSALSPGAALHEWGSAPGADNQTMLHIAPPGGGSIAMSKHIYPPGDPDTPKDPVNVIFHHHGAQWWFKQALYDGGWDETACGWNRELLILNKPHGGTNGFEEMHEQWDNKIGWTICPTERSHVREFHGDSKDTHAAPNFGVYSQGPAHYEEGDHSEDTVSPSIGQDDLYFDIIDGEHIGSWETILVSNSASECAVCGKWDGLIDFYELLSDDHMWHSAPCSVDRYDHWTGAPGTMNVKFYCD